MSIASLMLLSGCGQFGSLLSDVSAELSGTPTAKVESESPAFEGNEVEFVFRLSRASATDVQLFYEVTDGSAEAGVDFPEALGSVIIPAGETQISIRVPTTRRSGIQGNRTMQIAITNVVGAQISSPVAQGEIKDVQASPGLFTDLNTAPLTQNLGRLNDTTVLFFAHTAAHGLELWKSDGTVAGTVMVKDINPGPAGSYSTSSPASVKFVEYAGKIYFTARTDAEGFELWSTDGTDAGTTMIPSAAPGVETGYYSGLLVVNGFLYFVGSTATGTMELYRTNGTTITKVTNLAIMDGWSAVQGELANVGNRIVFEGYCGGGGWNLCGYDGAATSTILTNGGMGSLFPTVNFTCGGRVYLIDNNGAPYSTDGTAGGTIKLNSNNSAFIGCSAGTAFFRSTTAANGLELWKTQGTVGTTSIVKDQIAGAGSLTFGNPSDFDKDIGRSSYVTDSVSLTPKLIYTANDSTNGVEPFFSDGTAPGTGLLKNIQPAALNSFSGNYYFDSSTNLVYFTAEDQTSGSEVWRSDFTAAGTIQILDIAPGAKGSMPTSFFRPGPAAPLFFLAVDPLTSQSRLFVSNGTPAGTTALPAQVPNRSSGVSLPVALANGSLVFSGDDGNWGQMIWKSLGRPDSLEKVIDLMPNNSCTSIANQIAMGNVVYFTRTDTTTGNELWRTDGTATGTMLVKDIYAGGSSSSPTSLKIFGNKLIFNAMNATEGTELWISDGTGFGTTLVKDINPGVANAGVTGMTVVNDKMYFAATEPVAGTELWVTDGTTAGTSMINDILPGAPSSAPQGFTAFAGKVYFTAIGTGIGREFYVTDGTALGTSLVLDINPGAPDSNPLYFSVLGNKLLFNASTSASGAELWASDGTGAGTAILAELMPAGSSSYPYNFALLGTKLLFTASVPGVPSPVQELIVTDGTAPGTTVLKVPGIDGLLPSGLTVAGSTVFFTGTSPTNGTELWKTRGTIDTTVQAAEHRPGIESSTFGVLKYEDGVLFYTVNSPLEGTELFVAHPD